MAKTQEIISKIARAAQESERLSGLPRELTFAQCALESGWLDRMSGENNCFGIKYVPGRHKAFKEVMTREVLRPNQMEPGDTVIAAHPDGRVKVKGVRKFASYPSLADCFADHARLITEGTPYRAAWQAYQQDRDVVRLIRAISPIYATDPGYANTVLRIVGDPLVASALRDEILA